MTLIIKETGIEQYKPGGDGRIKMLMLGAPDAGKTRSASFWPKPLIADCEDGLASVADRKVPYAPIRSTADMKALLDMLEAECKKPVAQRRYETVVIDTLDAFQRIVIQERLRLTKSTAMQRDDWGFLDGVMQLMVERLNALPMNVIVNNHVKDQKIGDGDSAYFVSGIKLKGDIRDSIAAEFDLIGYMSTHWAADKGERVLRRSVQWQPTPGVPVCRDRFHKLPASTPINFTSEDYEQLLVVLTGTEGLSEGDVLDELQTAADVVLEAPTSGPVTTKAPAKKAAPEKPVSGPVKSPAPERPVAPAAPRPTVPAATKPVAASAPEAPVAPPAKAEEPSTVTEDAVATVVDTLGGEVISDTVEAEAPVLACGSPRFPDQPATFVPAPGCGKVLELTFEDGRVTGAQSGESPDLIEIAGLRTQTLLCNSCFGAYRNSNRK